MSEPDWDNIELNLDALDDLRDSGFGLDDADDSSTDSPQDSRPDDIKSEDKEDSKVCRNCGSEKVEYYDGCLGYEAVVCKDCGEHHTEEHPLNDKEDSVNDYEDKLPENRDKNPDVVFFFENEEKSGVIVVGDGKVRIITQDGERSFDCEEKSNSKVADEMIRRLEQEGYIIERS